MSGGSWVTVTNVGNSKGFTVNAEPLNLCVLFL